MALNLGYDGPRSEPEQQLFQNNDFVPNKSALDNVMAKREVVSSSANQLAEANIASVQAERKKAVMTSMMEGVPPSQFSGNLVGYASNGSPVGDGFTITDDGMYNSYTKLRGNKAYRNNNPGNISGMSGNLLYGAKGFARNSVGDVGDRSQLVFQTPQAGWKAMYSLMSGDSYNNAPINKAFSKYQSDQDIWKSMVGDMRANGINADRSTFNQLNNRQKVWFMNQRARHEGFTGAPVSYEMLR